MSSDKFLNYCTASLVFSGAIFKNRSHLLRIFQIILLGNCFVVSWLPIQSWLKKSRIQGFKGHEILEFTTEVTASVFQVLFPLWFIWKKKSIVKLTQEIYQMLPVDSQSKVTRIALVMMMIDVGHLLFRVTVSDCLNCLSQKQGTLLFTWIYKIIEALPRTSIVTGCCVYASFLYMLYTLINNQFQLIQSYLRKVKKPNLLVINNALHKLLDFLKEFDANFSFLPFIWFSNTFWFTSINVIIMSSDNLTLNSRISFVLVFVAENVATFSIIILLSRLRMKLEKHSDTTAQMLAAADCQSLHGCFLRISIKTILDSIASFRMTAFSLFHLDLSLVLSLAGNLLTFTVLFIQLTKSSSLC